MASLLAEYVNMMKTKGFSALEDELLPLLKRYREVRGNPLFLYVAAVEKPVQDRSLSQEDYYDICDLLRDLPDKTLDVYIETPGGKGESAEEIVKFLREKFQKVNFVISGEAKSAGTIIVLSGNEILMTKTGSLGPIDAQVRIGRCTVSAYDYHEWIEDKRKKAEAGGRLNPADATIIAQISPGELKLVENALFFAKDLVVDWLTRYKFADWTITETRKLPVTDQMRKQRAEEVADKLLDHGKWRHHGRSLKIGDLRDEVGLRITCVDDDAALRDIVYRIQTICRLMFHAGTAYKIFATEAQKMVKNAGSNPAPNVLPAKANVVEIELGCGKCGRKQKFYVNLMGEPEIDEAMKRKGISVLPEEGKFVCPNCGNEVDLSDARRQLDNLVKKHG